MNALIQPPPPAYRKWWWLPVTVVVIALVIGAVIWVPKYLNSCGPGVVKYGPDDTCVGLTDGSVSFHDDLQAIEAEILAENDRVTGSGEPAVSLVLLTPMTPGPNGAGIVTMAGIRHRLEGAHLAQRAANRTSVWGDTPQIKLLLANPGTDFSAWGTAVREIEERKEDDNIVAVTGISFSVQAAIAALEHLSEAEIPVVGSTLTTGDLARLRGLLRVSPPAAEHARAAAEYLAPRSEQILIVRDNSQDDSYGRTLAEAFADSFPDEGGRFAADPASYDSGAPGIGNTFRNMLPNICRADPDTIYFAGRAAHALEFLTVLGDRDCHKPIQLITGDDMPYYELSESPAKNALKTGISVYYTGLAHQQLWQHHGDWFSPQAMTMFSDDCTGEICYNALSTDRPSDFAALMEHDAVRTAVAAIRQADLSDGPVRSGDVLQEMNRLRGETAPLGATGKLSFDENGLPDWKPLPILEARVGESPRFVALPLPKP